MTVNTFKRLFQMFQTLDYKVFNMYFLLECVLLLMEAHKTHMLVGHHQTINMSVFGNNNQFGVCY